MRTGKQTLDFSKGLTLLEALVAMAIIGASFSAILQLQSNLVRSLRTVEAAHIEAAWRANIVEVAASIDHPANRNGTMIFPTGETIDWRAIDDGRSVSSASRTGLRTRGDWIVQLAPIEFTVTQHQDVIMRSENFAAMAERRPTSPPP